MILCKAIWFCIGQCDLDWISVQSNGGPGVQASAHWDMYLSTRLILYPTLWTNRLSFLIQAMCWLKDDNLFKVWHPRIRRRSCREACRSFWSGSRGHAESCMLESIQTSSSLNLADQEERSATIFVRSAAIRSDTPVHFCPRTVLGEEQSEA